MKKEANLFLFLFYFGLSAFSQGLINNGAVIDLNSGPYIYIDGGTNGDFTNQDDAGPSYGSVAVTTSGTIQLEGDWTNNSASTLVFTNTSAGNVEFLGSTAQSIGGTSTTNFATLTINNSSGIATGVTTGMPTLVAVALTLTNGVVNTASTNFLRLMDGATTTIGSASSFINGPLRYSMVVNGTRTLNLPLGKGSDWRPAILTPTHNNSVTKIFYLAELFDADAQTLGFTLPGTFTHVSHVHYYSITRSSTSEFTSATLQIYYSNTNGSNDGVTDATNLGVAKDNGSGSWVNITSGGGSANNVGNILSASYTPQNTYFALANKTGGTNPLPITLLNFSGECFGESERIIKWTTATETNNNYFSLEKSYDGITYTTIATIPGSGNRNSPKNYFYTDVSSLHQQPVYYRLKQTDYDGNSNTFEPIAIECTNDISDNSFSLYPNPSDGSFTLLFSSGIHEDLQLKITDLLGQELFVSPVYANDNTERIEINLKNKLSAGTYLISVFNNTTNFNQKLIIY